MDSQADRANTECGPLSFEDLPDQAIGIILRKLKRFQDRFRLTQASPSARRLTRGPNCEPGVMGETLYVEVMESPDASEKAAYIDIAQNIMCTMNFNPSHPDFPLALDYLAARSKAFSRIDVVYNGSVQGHDRLLDALYRQGACSPVALRFSASYTSSFRKYLDAVQALVSHWLTVSEGIHSPKDRNIKFGEEPEDAKYDLFYLTFLGRLKGIGGLQFSEPDEPSLPFPEFPHLTDCLERLFITSACARTLPGFYPAFSALKSIEFRAVRTSQCHDPRPYLRKLFESSAASLESVALWFGTKDSEPPFTMNLFEGLPKLKSLTLWPDVHLLRARGVHSSLPPSPSDTYFQTDIVLPSLEELAIISESLNPDTSPPLFFLSNLVLPRLRKLDINAAFNLNGSDRTVDVGRIARFPSLVDVHLSVSIRKPGPSVLVSLGDLSDLTRLRKLSIRARGTTVGLYDGAPPMLRVQESSSVLPPQMRGVAANEELLASSEGRDELVFNCKRA